MNGVDRDVAAGWTVDDVVSSFVEAPERGVAVALDGDVVPRSEWCTTTLVEGQSVEVLRAVQGG